MEGLDDFLRFLRRREVAREDRSLERRQSTDEDLQSLFMRTRGELLQVELDEERLRIAGIAVFAVAAAFFLALAIVVLTFFLLLLFWDSNRLLAAGLISLAYFMIGLICASVARQRARVKSKLFAASLAELGKDNQRLDSERLKPS